MIDTVTFGFHIEPSISQLKRWDHHCMDEIRDERVWIRHNTNIRMPGGWTVQAEFYPQNVTSTANIPLLKIKFSLPKALYGNNAKMLSDVSGAIDIANKELHLHTQIPPIDLNEGGLYRLDTCYNHQVGEFVQDYIGNLFNLDYPRHKTGPYHQDRHQGVQFKTNSASTSFYDKHFECRLPQAYGILRQENTQHDRGRIEKILGIEQPTINSITKDRVKEILEHDLEVLKLNVQGITNRETAAEILVATYGSKRGYSLIGYLVRRQTMSEEQIMTQDNLNQRQIYRLKKDIADTGISMALGEKIPLPPLRIEL
jgi:hypothetical protein